MTSRAGEYTEQTVQGIMCLGNMNTRTPKMIFVGIYYGADLYKDKRFIPSWSLSRLLEMIPSNIEDDYCSAGLQVTPPVISYYNYLDKESYMLFNRVSIFDNAIECIGWLIRNDHFNKEYLIEKDNEL